MSPADAKLPEAWVLGDLDMVSPLAMAGIPCAVIAPPGDPARYSRRARVVGWADPWREPEELLRLLLREGARAPSPPVLFYQSDQYALFTARYREQLAPAFRFVLPNGDRLEECTDKLRFWRLAEELDLPVPAAQLLEPGPRPPEIRLRFPLLLKPPTRADARWLDVDAASKAVRVSSAAELEQAWPRLMTFGGALLAQELVPGPETKIESYHAYVRSDGEVVAEFTGRKVRTRPAEYGHSTALTVEPIPDVREEGRRLAEVLGLTGVLKLDLKRAPDDSLVLLEVNPRFNLWHHIAAYTGVNLPAEVWSDLTGLPVPRRTRPRATASWCSPWDLQTAREWGVPVHAWLRWAATVEARSMADWRDPAPFLRLSTQRLQRKLRRG